MSHPPTNPAVSKYLAFSLGGEEFAVPVARVREILPLQEVTPVPQAATCLRGVLNLRGKVLPVMDLRLRLGLPRVEESAYSAWRRCIIVIEGSPVRGRNLIGILVDGVSEVLQIKSSDLEDLAAMGPFMMQCGHVRQIARIKDTMKFMLELDSLLNLEPESMPAGLGI